MRFPKDAFIPSPARAEFYVRRVKELEATNAELLDALKLIAQMQRDKCENADAETLFMILDNKVSIARAATAKAEKENVNDLRD